MAEDELTADRKATLARWERENVLHPWRVQGGDVPLVVRARGSRFWDADGRGYLDFTSQLVFANLGHAEPRLSEAAERQMRKLPVMDSMYGTEPKAELAHLLATITPGDLNRTMFTTSGAEATEAALEIVRAATGREKIVTRYLSYHGSTLGAASVTRDPRVWGRPDPGNTVTALDPYCYRCPFGLEYPSCKLRCADHIRDLIRWNGGADYVAGVIVEPITGANGVIVPPDGYLQRLREICTAEGVKLIADEVMVGFGRTGKWFACEHWGVVPDVLTLSKGLTNGELPLAATVVREDLARAFTERPLRHGHTASGNTTACAVAIRAIEIYRDEGLVDRSRVLGHYLRERALELANRHACIGDVRGLGLFVGLELVRDRATREPFAEWPQTFLPRHLRRGGAGRVPRRWPIPNERAPIRVAPRATAHDHANRDRRSDRDPRSRPSDPRPPHDGAAMTQSRNLPVVTEAAESYVPPFPWDVGIDATSLSTKRGFVFQFPPFPALATTDAEVIDRRTPAALYAHVPFCPYRCSYCYYAVEVNQRPEAVTAYLDSLEREMALVAARPAVRRHRLTTAFIGGGTPTYLGAAELARLVEGLHTQFDLSHLEELTVESDPTTLDLEKLIVLRERNVNRISIGVQTFSDELNELNQRHHTLAETLAAIDAVRRAGIGNLNLDLICGLIGETAENWRATIDRLLEVAPEHVTIYLFSFRPQTGAYVRVQNGKMPSPP